MDTNTLTREARCRITPKQKVWLLSKKAQTGQSESTIIRNLINDKIQDHE